MPLICTCQQGHRWEHRDPSAPESAVPPCPECGAPAAAVFEDAGPPAQENAARAPEKPAPFDPQILSLDPVREGTPPVPAPVPVLPVAPPAGRPRPPQPAAREPARPPLPRRPRTLPPPRSATGPVVLAVVLTSAVFLVLALLGGVLWYSQSARQQEERARLQRREAEGQAALNRAQAAQLAAADAERQLRQQLADEQGRRMRAEQDAQQARLNADVRLRQERKNLRAQTAATAYAHCVALAGWELRAGDVARARHYLAECPPEAEAPRKWEWHYLARACGPRRLAPLLHPANVLAAGFSADGKRLVAVGLDGSVTVRDSAGAEVASAPGRPGPVVTAAFGPGGTHLAVCDRPLRAQGKALKILDMNAQEVRALRGPEVPARCLALSPDGKRLALATGTRAAVWDAETDREAFPLTNGGVLTTAVAFSADGKRLASAHSRPGAPPNSGEVKVWDAASGKLLRTLKTSARTATALALGPGGVLLAAGTVDRGVQVWDLAGSAREPLKSFTQDPSWVWGVQFSADGKRLFCGHGNGVVRAWDPRGGRALGAFQAPPRLLRGLAASPDGSRLATVGSGREVWLWGLGRQDTAAVLKGHAGAVHAVAFSPDGKRLASAGQDRTVRLWDVAARKQLRLFEGHTLPVTRVVFDLAGNRLATVSAPAAGEGQAVEVKVWDAGTGKELFAVPGYAGTGVNVAFSPAGGQLAVASPGKPLKAWDCATGKETPDFRLRGAGPRVGDAVDFLAVSPDGARVAVAARGAVTVFLAQQRPGWVENRTVPLPGQPGPVTGLAWAADGERLAVCSPGHVKVWDTNTATGLGGLRGQAVGLPRFALGRDRQRMAAAKARQVRLWELGGKGVVLSLEGQTEPVTCTAFSPDGHRIASGALDGAVMVWDGTPDNVLAFPAGKAWPPPVGPPGVR
jgi:WD40 repeat protein